MPLLTRAFGLLRRTGPPRITSKAWASQKPPQQSISAVDQAIGLTVLFSAFLIPSGWILAHLEDYKSRPE